MDENGNEAKREKSGKCCCAISTIVIIIVLGLGVVAFVYREEIVKEYTKFISESNGKVDDNFEKDSTTKLYAYGDVEYPIQTDRTTTVEKEDTTKSLSEYGEYEEYDVDVTTSGNVLIDSQEYNNESDDSDLDSDELIFRENKIKHPKNTSISIDHLSEIFRKVFNKTENDSDEDPLELIPLRSSTAVPAITVLYEGSGSNADGYTKSKTNKTIVSDDEDYQNGLEGST